MYIMGFEYSKEVMKNFLEPQNMGKLENASGTGEVGSPACGDIMKLQIKIKDNIIEDIKFQTFGCAAAIASTSMITQMVKGKPLEYAETLTMKQVAEELKGLPQIKMHCSTMGIQTLKRAIKDYKINEGLIEKPEDWDSKQDAKEAREEHIHIINNRCIRPNRRPSLERRHKSPICWTLRNRRSRSFM
jgi:nitrogen fixation NifU-like protein